jgi:hypothetical protein
VPTTGAVTLSEGAGVSLLLEELSSQDDRKHIVATSARPVNIAREGFIGGTHFQTGQSSGFQGQRMARFYESAHWNPGVHPTLE